LDPKSVYWRMFEVTLEKRGRSRWWWRVQDLSGKKAFMTGWENSRSEAKYQGERALFLLLIPQAEFMTHPKRNWILTKSRYWPSRPDAPK